MQRWTCRHRTCPTSRILQSISLTSRRCVRGGGLDDPARPRGFWRPISQPRLVILPAAIALAAACKKEEQPPKEIASPASALLGPGGPKFIDSLVPRLEAERSSRPTDTVPAEAIVTAFSAA